MTKRKVYLEPRPTIEDRFWSKVDKNGPVPEHRPDLGPCWLWTGGKNGLGRGGGYGAFWVRGRGVRAHRFAYEITVGPAPDGLTLDHLCHPVTCLLGPRCPHRACVNPAHLEAVPTADNSARGNSSLWPQRKTHCPQGHPYSGENLMITGRGHRECRACKRASRNGWRSGRRTKT